MIEKIVVREKVDNKRIDMIERKRDQWQRLWDSGTKRISSKILSTKGNPIISKQPTIIGIQFGEGGSERDGPFPLAKGIEIFVAYELQTIIELIHFDSFLTWIRFYSILNL